MNAVYRLRTSDGTIVVEATGSGPALLLLHGISGNRRSWDGVTARLSSRFTVLAADLPARGDSDIPYSARYGLEHEVRRVSELTQQAGIASTVVVGHSHGASIALGLARNLPSVAGLVLVNPVTPWSRRPLLLSFPGLRHSTLLAAALSRFRKPVTRYILERRVLQRGRRADPNLVERYAAAYKSPRRAQALLAALSDWDPSAQRSFHPRRRLPVLVLAGVADRRMRLGDTARLAELLGARYLLLAGAGHALPDERPDLVSDAIRELAEPLDLPPFEPAGRNRNDGKMAQA